MVMSGKADFRSAGKVHLVQRAIGQNTVGVVAWLLLLRTPECPDGRQVSATARNLSPCQFGCSLCWTAQFVCQHALACKMACAFACYSLLVGRALPQHGLRLLEEGWALYVWHGSLAPDQLSPQPELTALQKDVASKLIAFNSVQMPLLKQTLDHPQAVILELLTHPTLATPK